MKDDLLTSFLDSDMFAMIFYALLIILFVYGEKVKSYIYEKYKHISRFLKYLIFFVLVLTIIYVNFSYFNGNLDRFLTSILNYIFFILLFSQLKVSYKHFKKDKRSI